MSPTVLTSGVHSSWAVINCERQQISARKVGVKSYGVGQESGHYIMLVDEVDAGRFCLPQ